MEIDRPALQRHNRLLLSLLSFMTFRERGPEEEEAEVEVAPYKAASVKFSRQRKQYCGGCHLQSRCLSLAWQFKQHCFPLIYLGLFSCIMHAWFSVLWAMRPEGAWARRVTGFSNFMSQAEQDAHFQISSLVLNNISTLKISFNHYDLF